MKPGHGRVCSCGSTKARQWQWLVVTVRTGTAAQAAKTRARARQGVAVAQDAGANKVDGYCGYGHWWLRPLVATTTGGYGQRRGRCSEAQGGRSWNGNGLGLGRGSETGGWEGEYEMILK